MVKVSLDRSEIDQAIVRGQATLARYVAAYGEYNNTFNSHTKGRFGEIALHKYFSGLPAKVIPHYMDPTSDWLCDIEVPSAIYPRIEVKTWSENLWPELGRCFTPKQAGRLHKKADAVIWCSAPLPILASPKDLDGIESLDVTLRAFSLPADILAAPIRWTGDENMRKVLNHQLDEATLRPILASLKVS